jgi:mRNA interferase MazF
MSPIKRFEVYHVNLDPTIGAEIAKSRPCVVLSPDEMNAHLQTVIVAPLTSTVRSWPSRVLSRFAGMKGEVALDQLRAVDKLRLAKRLGELDTKTQASVFSALGEMFAP